MAYLLTSSGLSRTWERSAFFNEPEASAWTEISIGPRRMIRSTKWRNAAINIEYAQTKAISVRTQPLLLSIDGREVCCLIRQYRLLQGVDLLLHRTVELLNLPAACLKHPARLRSLLAAFRVRDRDGLGFQNDTIPVLPPLRTPDCVLAPRPQYLCRDFDDDSRFHHCSHDTLRETAYMLLYFSAVAKSHTYTTLY